MTVYVSTLPRHMSAIRRPSAVTFSRILVLYLLCAAYFTIAHTLLSLPGSGEVWSACLLSVSPHSTSLFTMVSVHILKRMVCGHLAQPQGPMCLSLITLAYPDHPLNSLPQREHRLHLCSPFYPNCRTQPIVTVSSSGSSTDVWADA